MIKCIKILKLERCRMRYLLPLLGIVTLGTILTLSSTFIVFGSFADPLAQHIVRELNGKNPWRILASINIPDTHI